MKIIKNESGFVVLFLAVIGAIAVIAYAVNHI